MNDAIVQENWRMKGNRHLRENRHLQENRPLQASPMHTVVIVLVFMLKIVSTIIPSFIHSGYLYSAPSRNLLRVALSPATVEKKCLKNLAERRHVTPRQQAATTIKTLLTTIKTTQS